MKSERIALDEQLGFGLPRGAAAFGPHGSCGPVRWLGFSWPLPSLWWPETASTQRLNSV